MSGYLILSLVYMQAINFLSATRTKQARNNIHKPSNVYVYYICDVILSVATESTNGKSQTKTKKLVTYVQVSKFMFTLLNHAMYNIYS